MDINIRNEYRISSYPYGLKVQRSQRDKNGSPKKDENGKILWKSAKYHNNLEGLLKVIYREEILDTNATTFDELMKEIKEIKQYIKDITKDLNFESIDIEKDTN